MVLDSVWLVRPGVLRHVTTFDRGGALLILRPFSACMDRTDSWRFGILPPKTPLFRSGGISVLTQHPIFTNDASHLAPSNEVVGCFYNYATFSTSLLYPNAAHDPRFYTDREVRFPDDRPGALEMLNILSSSHVCDGDPLGLQGQPRDSSQSHLISSSRARNHPGGGLGPSFFFLEIYPLALHHLYVAAQRTSTAACGG